MKHVIATALALGVLAGAPALAADLSSPQVYAPIAAPYDWTGFHIGANVGYAWGDAGITFGGATGSGDYDGFIGGLQLGYTGQFGAFVLGVEADIQATGIDYDETFGGVTASSDVNWLGTVRARAGFAWDRFLPYITGGLAYGQNDISFTAGGVTLSDDTTHVGWTVGGGVEGAITDNISLRVEYLYVDLGDETYFSAVVPGGFDADADFHIARIGVNYRF